MSVEDIATRFARETAEHQMTVLHDDGLYRHLRFKAPGSSMYWFDLITVPGTLIFRGDGESFVFARVTDMFEFFRGERINPQYWSEKLTANRDAARRYDRDIYVRHVKEATLEAIEHGADPGLRSAVWRELLGDEVGHTAAEAHEALRDFAYWENDADQYSGFREVDGKRTWVPAKRPDFQFGDTWEWDLTDYDWWFLWSLHAIVWGIAEYDAHHAETLEAAS